MIFTQDKLEYWGPTSEVVLQKNDLNFAEERFFVEFLPSGLYQLSGQSQNAFVNHREDLELYNLQLKNELEVIYKQANTYEELIEALNLFFIEKESHL